MKTFMLALAFGIAAVRSDAEGTIHFANSRLTRILITQPDNTTRLATAEDNLLIGVFYDTNSFTSVDSLVPAPGLATIGPEPGVMTNAPVVFQLPGTEPGSTVSLQVRAWDAALGPDGWRLFREPWRFWRSSPYCEAGGNFYGETKVSPRVLGSSNGPSTILWQTASGLNPDRFTPLVLVACPNTNIPPTVSWITPSNSAVYGLGTHLKLKATASDTDGEVTQVQFYANSELIGTATNAPFTLVWTVGAPGGPDSQIKAVAIDDGGATNESTSLSVLVSGSSPVRPEIQLISPLDGTMLPAPATFEFAAEVLASTGDTGPIEFLVDDVPVGQVEGDMCLSATTPPSSVTVRNLREGDHILRIRYLGESREHCTCNEIRYSIHVVRLGIHSPIVLSDGRARFDVVTSYPGRVTVIESSQNFTDWIPVATVVSSTSFFTFIDFRFGLVDSNLFNLTSNRFYRIRVPAD